MTNNIEQVWEKVVCLTNNVKIKCGMAPKIQFVHEWQETNLPPELEDDIANTLGVTRKKLEKIVIWDLELPLAA
jgi:hypothetical protein